MAKRPHYGDLRLMFRMEFKGLCWNGSAAPRPVMPTSGELFIQPPKTDQKRSNSSGQQTRRSSALVIQILALGRFSGSGDGPGQEAFPNLQRRPHADLMHGTVARGQ